MKKLTILFSLLLLVVTNIFAQKQLKQVITLQMTDNGNNAGSVVWHPFQKKYYANYDGSSDYSIDVFDANGNAIQNDVKSNYDLREAWYNPSKKAIEFNGYDKIGTGHYQIDGKGLLEDRIIDVEGMNQPDDQSVGVYFKNNQVAYFSKEKSIQVYDITTGAKVKKLVDIHVGCSNKTDVEKMLDAYGTEEERWYMINQSVAIYTGTPKSEWAILNVDQKKIEFYDEATGFMSKTFLAIPNDIELEYNFNFSFSNNIWWFFNKKEKKWYGYSTSGVVLGKAKAESNVQKTAPKTNITKIETPAKEITNSNIKNNIVINNEGFTILKAGLYFDDRKPVPINNTAAVNENVNLVIELDGGWKVVDGKVFPGASEKIATDKGETILSSEDLYKSYEATGVSEKDANYLTLKAIITKVNKEFKYALVKFKVWDKKTGNTISGSYKLYIK